MLYANEEKTNWTKFYFFLSSMLTTLKKVVRYPNPRLSMRFFCYTTKLLPALSHHRENRK